MTKEEQKILMIKAKYFNLINDIISNTPNKLGFYDSYEEYYSSKTKECILNCEKEIENYKKKQYLRNNQKN